MIQLIIGCAALLQNIYSAKYYNRAKNNKKKYRFPLTAEFIYNYHAFLSLAEGVWCTPSTP